MEKQPDRRNAPSPEYVDAIVRAIREDIASLTVPHEVHKEHHEFVAVWIAKQKTKEERWERIRTQVGGWAVIAFLGMIGTFAYHMVQAFIREASK